jgi:hypothetical protein
MAPQGHFPEKRMLAILVAAALTPDHDIAV